VAHTTGAILREHPGPGVARDSRLARVALRTASGIVIPLLLIAVMIEWKSKCLIDDRKIRGLRAEINTHERRLQQAHDKQELVANQVKILRDAVMQEYAKLKKGKENVARAGGDGACLRRLQCE
jgi:hypothetical protein